jgi:hypothetical protein
MQARIAGATPPAASTWLFFIMTMSNRPMRWLAPPPASTAHLSSSRNPGAVLRVSMMREPVPWRMRTLGRFASDWAYLPDAVGACVLTCWKASTDGQPGMRGFTAMARSPRMGLCMHQPPHADDVLDMKGGSGGRTAWRADLHRVHHGARGGGNAGHAL